MSTQVPEFLLPLFKNGDSCHFTNSRSLPAGRNQIKEMFAYVLLLLVDGSTRI